MLHPDWKIVATRAYSMWLGYLAGLCALAAELMPLLPYLDGLVAPRTLTLLTYGFGALAVIARLLPQEGTLQTPVAPRPAPPAPDWDDPFSGWGPPPPRGTCLNAPDGWWCSRQHGHEGPCPAWPNSIKPDGETGVLPS
jgi:hypothetical protein